MLVSAVNKAGARRSSSSLVNVEVNVMFTMSSQTLSKAMSVPIQI